MRKSIRPALARVTHRFRERVCPRIHVALRCRDVRVTSQHLKFVHRDAIVGETRQGLMAKVVPVQVDLPKCFTLQSPVTT
jgi:hypothetical protein